MQAVHELGHVSRRNDQRRQSRGSHVASCHNILYTRLAENPHPLFVAWMGPLIGVVLPLVAFAFARWAKLPGWYLIQFFAGFCLIANGAYLAFGSFDRVGDAGDMLRHGTPIALLWLFGLITIPVGFWLWNGLGPHFGLGASSGQVDRSSAYAVFALLVALVSLELALS